MSVDHAEATWERLGCRMRPTRGLVAVVTDKPPTHTAGGLILPEKLTGFYGPLPHQVVVRATVLSVGPKVSHVKVGDRVAFPRTPFIRWKELEPGVMVGWVDQSQIAGFFAEAS